MDNFNFEVVDNRTFKQKVKDGLLDAKRKAVEVGQWVAKHPMETIGIVTCGVATVSEARRVYDRVDEKREARKERLSVYCNDVQGRVQLKHELNYKESKELRDRMNNGQTKFEALDEMRLLK